MKSSHRCLRHLPLILLLKASSLSTTPLSMVARVVSRSLKVFTYVPRLHLPYFAVNSSLSLCAGNTFLSSPSFTLSSILLGYPITDPISLISDSMVPYLQKDYSMLTWEQNKYLGGENIIKGIEVCSVLVFHPYVTHLPCCHLLPHHPSLIPSS